jgi:hypothetical protein
LGEARRLAVSEALNDIAGRLERLTVEPDHAATGMKRFVAPVLRVLKWEPKLDTAQLTVLVDALGEERSRDRKELEPLLEAALAELRENTSTLEQACAVAGHAPPALVTWLGRLWKILRRAEKALDEGLVYCRPEASLLAPPLVEPSSGGRAPGRASAVDPLLAAARAEQSTLGRRRRLLEAARQVLLESAAASTLDRTAVEARRSYIAEEIALIDRLEAAGLSPRVSLVHQARTAVSRGDVQKAHAALVAMDGAAARSGDFELARLTGSALRSLWKDQNPHSADARAESLARSGVETFSPQIRHAIEQGIADGRRNAIETAKSAKEPASRAHAKRAIDYLGDDAEQALILAALHVDGCFDVGGVLSPQRAVEEHRRIRQVTFPTQDLALMPAHAVEDVPDALIEDPRRVLHDFAAGRLLSRRYVVEEAVHRERTVMRGEVRAYVLDGSSSMLGPRARMRDAIMLAELSTLISRYGDRERRVEPVMCYRYFDTEPGPVSRVDNASRALAAIESIVSTVHHGGTDIQRALLTSLDDVRVAREADDALARAQIVLVTDGAAAVDRDAVLNACSAVGQIPIGISIIALGQENDALRELAAFQRSRGEAVFYHFIPDDELTSIVEGKKGLVSVHLPEALAPADLKRELGELVEEIDALRRVREEPDSEASARSLTAFDAVGLSPSDEARSAVQARLDLARRDESALGRAFDRWFPPTEPCESEGPELVPPSDEAECLDVVKAVLCSAAEVIDLVGSSPLERKIDAIELVERLLIDAGVPHWRYADFLRRYPAALAPEIRRVRSVLDGCGAPVPTPRRGH